jgi:hypothetical protein
MKKVLIASALTLNLMAPGAFADENHSGEEVGSAGYPGKVSRTIKITMVDNRFEPSKINVKRDETIKFMLRIPARKSMK